MRSLSWVSLAWVVVAASLASADDKPAAKLDRHGDPLPEGAAARLGTTRLRAHGWCIAFSADGKLMAQGTSERNARLWDTTTGREVQRFSGSNLGQVMDVVLSPNGERLATFDADNGLLLWDAQTGKFRCGTTEKLKGRKSLPVRKFVFSPDSETLYAVHGGDLFAVNARFGHLGKPPVPPEKGAGVFDVSPDGATAISATEDDRLVVWELATGKARGEVPRPKQHGRVALSAGGKRVAVATSDAEPEVIVYDPSTKKELCRCKGHQREVSAISFAPDGKSLVTGSGDLTARMWDAETGKERWSYRGGGATFYWVSAVFSPDGQTVGLIGWDGNPRVLYAATGKGRTPQGGHLQAARPLAITSDSKRVFTAANDQSIRQWDVATGEELAIVRKPSVDVYDPTTRRIVHADEWVDRLEIVPDGKSLAMSGHRDFRLWDISDPKSPRQGEKLSDKTFTAISSDGTRLAVLGANLQVLDAATKKVLHEIKNPEIGGNLLFSPDGRVLAFGGPNSTVYLYDARTLKKRAAMSNGGVQQVGSMSFTPDGHLLASGGIDWQVNIWEVATGKLRRGIARPRSMSNAVAFSPNGRFLAYGGGDKSIAVYDLIADRVAHTFRGHDGGVTNLAFSPDGRWLISLSTDTTGLVWDMRSVKVRAPGLVTRTPKELDAIWAKLSSGEATTAADAMSDLVAAPAQATEVIGRSMKPVEKATGERIAKLIGDLGSEVFRERENASAELAKLGEVAEPALRVAVNQSPQPETRLRAAELLDKLARKGPSPDQLRAIRSVQVLEWIGTPEAKKVLGVLAAGAKDAELTQTAAAALLRLNAR